MTPERWQEVKAILDSCLDQPPGERGIYLRTACADAELRAEVISLLAAYDDSTEFLEDSEQARRQLASALAHGAMKGRRVGPYELVEEVGRGGMGTVYRAVRADDEFDSEVAIKIVNRGLDSQLVLRRFRTERQILARLDHPNIARMLDGGTTETGLPYFVLEYVKGAPLSEYCDREHLGLNERLNLFLKVCDAVAYAHQNMVIHRDLKPGNILVTAECIPKLLDFGIAKIVYSDMQGEEDGTATALRMATPAYASPEQIRGEHVGVGSDVYSLGVILYELLTGHPPYRLSSESEELAQIICEREPTRPSTVVSYTERIGETAILPEAVAELRSTNVTGLQRQLRGDLDNILVMALRKDAYRRYQSVEQFSEDVRRFQAGLPVLARKDTLHYRSAKFVARHKAAVVIGSLAAVLMCMTAVYAIWKANQLSRRIDQDFELATSFVAEVHDSIARLPGSTPAREAILQQGLQYLNGLARDAGDDPALRRALALAYEKSAELQAGTMGSGLGLATAALETCRKAQTLREALALEQPNNRAIQYELLNNYLLSGYITGRIGKAEQRLVYDKRALALARKLVTEAPQNVDYQTALARAYESQSYTLTIYDLWEESRKNLRQALDIRTKLAALSPDNLSLRRDLARIRYKLGSSHAQARQPVEALPYLRQALAAQTGLIEKDPGNAGLSADLAATHHFLGVALHAAKEYKEASLELNEAIRLHTAALSSDARDARARLMLAGNYAELATVQLDVGKMRGALASIQQAVTLQQRMLDLDPRDIPARLNMADFCSRYGRIHMTAADVSTSGSDRSKNWRDAASWYGQSVRLYDNLRSEGHLLSPQAARDAERAKREGDEAAKQAGILTG